MEKKGAQQKRDVISRSANKIASRLASSLGAAKALNSDNNSGSGDSITRNDALFMGLNAMYLSTNKGPVVLDQIPDKGKDMDIVLIPLYFVTQSGEEWNAKDKTIRISKQSKELIKWDCDFIETICSNNSAIIPEYSSSGCDNSLKDAVYLGAFVNLFLYGYDHDQDYTTGKVDKCNDVGVYYMLVINRKRDIVRIARYDVVIDQNGFVYPGLPTYRDFDYNVIIDPDYGNGEYCSDAEIHYVDNTVEDSLLVDDPDGDIEV